MAYVDEDIMIEEKNDTKALLFGILILLYGFIVSTYFKIGLFSQLNSPESSNDFHPSILFLIQISTWLIRIFVVIYIVKIARRLNRYPSFWGVFGFIFPPISLIIISFLDYKVEDDDIKELRDKTRLDYNAELLFIKKNNDVSNKKFEEIKIELLSKYNALLKTRIIEMTSGVNNLATSETDIINNESYSIEDLNNSTNRAYDINNENNLLESDDISVCPACGAKLSNESDVCSDCGLSIK